MNLRWTIIIVILMTFTGLVAILTFSLQGILVPYFREEEERSVNLNVQRVLGVMENERGSLSEFVRSWAGSEDIYNLSQTADPAVIQPYLENSLLRGMNIDYLVFLDARGETGYAHAFSLENQAAVPVPPELTAALDPASPLLQDTSGQAAFSGMVTTSQGPLLVVSAPILAPDRQAPAAGTLIAGRMLTFDEINRIAGVVRFPLTLLPYAETDLPQDFSAVKTSLSIDQPIAVFATSTTQIAGFALLQDIYEEPAYILRLEQGRTIYRNNQIVLTYLYTAMIMGALLFSIMTFLAFDRLALSRIQLLGCEVTQIGTGGDLSSRVTVTRRDELTRVSEEINGMLANLQTLSHRLVEIQENERRAIALELHDEIGQLLTGLKLQLDTNARSGGDLNPQSLSRARQLTDDLVHKVRNLSLDLRPTMLDDLGLLPALLWHFDRFRELTGVQVDFSQNGLSDHRFSAEIESTAYRIVQEALTNVARHSGAAQASVRATYFGDLLTVQVEDRGSGFSVLEDRVGSRTRGLRGMKERVDLVGGSLTIDSVPGWGTSILVELPAKSLPDEGFEDDHNFIGG